LGNFTWGTKKFSQSPEVLIKQRGLDYADIAEIQVDEKYLRHKSVGVIHVERENFSASDGMRFVELAEDTDSDDAPVAEQPTTHHILTSEWKGTETPSTREFSCIISPLLGLAADGELAIGLGSTTGDDGVRYEAFKEPFIAGYTTESAQQEGLSAFQVDDVTWWVCLEDVKPEQQHRLRELLRRMRPWVALNMGEMRHCEPALCQHTLKPLPNAKWMRATYRKPFSPKEMTFLVPHCENLVKTDPPILAMADSSMIIEQTSNAVLVPKPGSGLRMCVNYIYLNSQCYPVVGEIKNLDEALRRLAGNLRISSTDGFSGFYAIGMDPGSQRLTAFVIPGFGVFYWKYMPFGLQGAPFTYSNLMIKVFGAKQNDSLQVYLDNVESAAGKALIGPAATTKARGMTAAEIESRAIDEAIDVLEFVVLPGFVKANMSINPGKSPLLAKRKITLGHVVSRYGISKSPELVSKFKSLLRRPIMGPKDVESINACLRYMSRYIPSLAEKTRFLSAKLKGWTKLVDPKPGQVLPKGRKKLRVPRDGYTFTWTDQDTEKLRALEDELSLDVTLQQFSPHYPIVAMFDASPWSISAVFGQLSTKLPDSPQSIAREVKPIVFLSKVLTDTQSRWSQPEREAYAIYHFVTENRHLLLGSKVYFFSDCRPITDAFRSSKLSKNLKISTWILALQEYDYEIYHIEGKTNILPDSLSRVPKDLMRKLEAEEKRVVEELHSGKAKDQDPSTMEIPVGKATGDAFSTVEWDRWRTKLMTFLRHGTLDNVETRQERRRLRHAAGDYALGDNGELLHRDMYGDLYPVPSGKEILLILHQYHDDPCGGHYAAEMTFRKVSRAFYWPKMRSHIFEYTRTCDKCQKAREFAIFPTEPLRPIICLEPFEIVTVDYSGPYETCRGYHYCLYIIDNFTGWLEVFPTRKADGETTKKALIAYAYRFGYPRVLHSDRGSHFDNETCLEWSKESGIKWVFGGPGVAKSQGKAERSIKDVKGTMRKVMMDEEGKKDWLSVLPQAQFAYNTRVPYGTYGLTPSVLLFGYTLRAPILNLVAPVPSLLELEGTLKVARELHRLREIRLQGVREEAVDRNLEYWRERSLKHDAGLRRHTYQVGDLVLVQNYALANGFGRPWDLRWKGPFKITHISRKGKVDLVDSIGTRLRSWHTDKLRPYHLRRSDQSEYEEFKASVQLAKETLATVVAGGTVVELR
jgi:hypothetical protein